MPGNRFIIHLRDVLKEHGIEGEFHFEDDNETIRFDDPKDQFLYELHGAHNLKLEASKRANPELDAGFFYCPYVPLQSNVKFDATTIKTRYGL